MFNNTIIKENRKKLIVIFSFCEHVCLRVMSSWRSWTICTSLLCTYMFASQQHCERTEEQICFPSDLHVLPPAAALPLVYHGGVHSLHSATSQNHTHHPLTLVTATLAPLFISWTTLSACPLFEATRSCSESVRTSAASSWLMKQRSRCCNSQTRSYRQHRGQPVFTFMLLEQLSLSSATRDRKPTRRNTWSVKP